MKLFVISIAVLSFLALDSEAIIRKCFPVTTPQPTTTPSADSSTTADMTTTVTDSTAFVAETTMMMTETTETTTSTTGPNRTLPPPSPYACDLWLRYNRDSSPVVNGFSAGVSAYHNAGNSATWVARGFRDSVLIPGRVQITGVTGDIYVTSGDEWITNPQWPESNSNGEGEYLVISDGCTCSWIPTYLASNHPGLVRTEEQFASNSAWGPGDFAIGRFTYADTRVSIGKVTTPFYYMKYTDPSGLEQNTQPTSAPEVLVCESITGASSSPTVTFPSDACGLWTKFKHNNWPITNGFCFGLDRFGNPGYVGRAKSDDYLWIGRVQLTEPMGIYVTNTGEPEGTFPEYLVVPFGCNCDWVAYSLAKTRVGLVRSIDYTYGFAIGRVSLGNDKYAISSVFTRDNWQKWIDATGTLITDSTPTELLVCEHL